MKRFLIAAMLVIMGERWEYFAHVGAQWCQAIEGGKCEGGVETYRRVYVIGESMTDWKCLTQEEVEKLKAADLTYECKKVQERFTIPVPNVPTKAMTKEEAEALSQK